MTLLFYFGLIFILLYCSFMLAVDYRAFVCNRICFTIRKILGEGFRMWIQQDWRQWSTSKIAEARPTTNSWCRCEKTSEGCEYIALMNYCPYGLLLWVKRTHFKCEEVRIWSSNSNLFNKVSGLIVFSKVSFIKICFMTIETKRLF
jgi:nicotinamide riboside transporter PnuC